MQLHPAEKFVITRQLQNPYITDTFYVRAVIRNANTGTVLSTVNLTDQTGQRFTYDYTVPADPSGQGFYISIVTSVYTDSGYTTKSENYGDEENTYLVQARYVFNPNYPVGADVDYKRIKKMIEDAIKNIVFPQPQEKTVIVTKEVVKEVTVPDVRIVEKFKEPNLTPVITAIAAVGKKVDDKEVTKLPEPVDMMPLLKRVEAIEKKTTEQLNAILEKIADTKFEVQLNPKIDMPKMKDSVKSPMDPRITKLIKRQ